MSTFLEWSGVVFWVANGIAAFCAAMNAWRSR